MLALLTGSFVRISGTNRHSWQSWLASGLWSIIEDRTFPIIGEYATVRHSSNSFSLVAHCSFRLLIYTRVRNVLFLLCVIISCISIIFCCFFHNFDIYVVFFFDPSIFRVSHENQRRASTKRIGERWQRTRSRIHRREGI